MPKNNIVKTDGTIDYNHLGVMDDNITSNSNQIGNLPSLQTTNKTSLVGAVNENTSSLAQSVQQKGTTQSIIFNTDGTIQKVQYKDGSNNVVREDTFTYATNLITEVRTVGSSSTTYKYHLDTLQTEVI